MRKDKQFLLEDHVRLAEQLCRMHIIALRYVARLSKSYPFSSLHVKRAWKVYKAIDSLRCEMDNVFYHEYPGPQFRKPHYEWVRTPYFNPKNEKRIVGDIPEQNDE